jgi:glucokinase
MILAVDIGGTTCKLGVFDKHCTLKSKWQIATDTSNNGENILSDIHQSFIQYFEAFDVNIESCLGVGIGVPGPVDFHNSVLNGAINLGWKEKKSIASEFEKISGLPAIIDNDANLAALGEQSFGAGGAEEDVVLITLGTGVGGGVVSHKKLMHGTSGSAGEIGHMKVDHEERFSCNCGLRGCLETVASATGMKNLAVHHYTHHFPETILADIIADGTVNAKDIAEAAEEGDALSIKVLDDVAEYIGLALSTISVIVNPKVIIIGGGVSQAGDLLLNKIDHAYRPHTFPPAEEDTMIKIAQLGNDAGIYGAAKLASQYI